MPKLLHICSCILHQQMNSQTSDRIAFIESVLAESQRKCGIGKDMLLCHERTSCIENQHNDSSLSHSDLVKRIVMLKFGMVVSDISSIKFRCDMFCDIVNKCNRKDCAVIYRRIDIEKWMRLAISEDLKRMRHYR